MLSPNRDRLGLQPTRVDWRLTDLERHTLQVTGGVVHEELQRLKLARVRPDEWLWRSATDWTDNLFDNFHHLERLVWPVILRRESSIPTAGSMAYLTFM
jgi:hypothetical protein